MNSFCWYSTVVWVAFAATFAAASVHGQDATTQIVLDGLNNPTGIAIQPKTGHVFVADSGALRVIRVVDGKAEDIIVGFPKDVFGKDPMYDIGPLGLLFLDESTLLVGGGGLPDGDDLLRVYDVPPAGSESIKADAMKASFRLAATDELKGGGNFYALTATQDAIFVTVNGDGTRGWLARARISGSKLEPLERAIATKDAVSVDAPVALTTSPRGELVVGQMGKLDVPRDGLLSFYNAKDGRLLLSLETGLSDVTGLAYSPKSQQLYATDFSWHDPSLGGLFQLVAKRVDGKQAIEAKRVTLLDKPTALAFAEDGTLYVTVIAEPGKGKLLKIGPGL